ncbi:succinylglutamate desuccinylase/aspartoacylase family protein [Aureimonas leprariae]|uniref:Succinylglutamate desuccinylase/aspartoacylase family protein n=1 Tax=Plantimonas leprariae TaxID=2615207 RepID=A0A7V7PSS1_9HYPH|nr:succinylglutamate desuccinylase/aspartoacylase family protein [Aureimonas leprariae]KAB0682558.1 succinylglutamate desuccinylase/aspartoacylase family protein [Aureimonas leprariae]
MVEKTVEVVRGDTPGTEWRLPVLRFRATGGGAPSAYLQAALHANELPGVVALHRLVPMLAEAERDGRLLGDVTVVPHANPIAAGEHLFSEHMGRFSFHSRTNYNRDFPLLDTTDTSGLPGDDAPVAAEKRLKARLLKLALGADLVLDLHCDDESLNYIYVPAPFWPHMRDLAASLGSEAVLAWRDSSDGAFEEAAYAPYRALPDDDPDWRRLAVTTVELRGRADVSPELAEADALGLYRFLVARGTIRDEGVEPPAEWPGEATPLDNVEMIRAPVGGAILFHARPGDRVEEGQLVATVIASPGEAEGEVAVTAPQAGLILTRRSQRSTRVGEDLMKLLGSRPSATVKKPGALES